MTPIERPRIILALLALSLAAAPGVSRLKFETDLESLLSRTSNDYLIYEEFAHEFGSDYVSVIVLEADDIFTPERLSAIVEITNGLRASDFTADVQSLTSAFNIESAFGLIGYVPLVSAPPTSSAESSRIRDRSMENPLIQGTLISKDRRTTAIFVVMDAQLTGDAAMRGSAMLDAAIAPHRELFDRAYHIGPPRFFSETEDAVSQDLPTIGAAAGALLLLILLVSMRSVAAVVAPALIGSIALVWTLGLMGRLGLPITMLSAALPALVFVIGSGETTYLIATYMRIDAGVLRDDRLRRTIQEAGLPCFLASVTTIAGFAAGGLFSVELVRNFALTMSIGLGLSFMATILILPLLLMYTPLGAVERPRKVERADRVAGKLSNFILALSPRIAFSSITAGGLGASILIIGAFDLRPAADALDMLGKQHPLAEDVARANDRLGGTQAAYLVIDGRSKDAFRNADAIRRLREIGDAIEKRPGFTSADSLSDMIYYAHSAQMNDPDAEDAHDALRQSDVDAILYVSPTEATRNFVSANFEKAVIVARHNIYDSRLLGDSLKAVENEIRSKFGDGFDVYTTGKSFIISRASERLVLNLLLSFLALVVIVASAIAVAFRSWRAGALSVIPNALPAAAVFGAMPLLGIPLNPGTALAAVVAIGIAVNDTIHLFNRFRADLATALSPTAALAETIKSQTRPVCATSFSLAAAFATCALSSSAAVAQFGLLCSIAILLALPSDLFLTTLLLREFGARTFQRRIRKA